MLKTLLKKQFSEIFRSYFINRKSGKARTAGRTAGMFILFASAMVFLGVIFFFMASFLGDYLLNEGKDWLYFALMGLTSILFGTFGSVFNTYASLYLAKDNDLLISMPIPSWIIVFSRVSAVFGLGMLYSMTVWIPTVIFYCIRAFSAAALIGGCVTGIMIGLFVAVLSCLLGWVVALIAGKLKNRNLITVLISLAFLALYYLFCFRLQNILEGFLMNSDGIGDFIRDWGRLIWRMGQGASGDLASLLIFSLITLALAFICFMVLERTFIRLATRSAGEKKKSIRIGKMKSSGTGRALFRREARRFLSSTTYMLNTGIGLVIMPAVSVVLALRAGQALELIDAFAGEAPWLRSMLPLAAYMILGLIAAINIITAPSVSMEGRSLWLIRSLPVSTRDVLSAKLRFGTLLNEVSVLVSALILVIPYRIPAIQVLLLIVLLMLNVCLNGLLGLVFGLKHPILNWTNEMIPVKQAISGLLAMLTGWLLAVLIPVGGFFGKDVMSMEAILLLAIAVLAAAFLLLRKWLYSKGVMLFESL